MKINIDTNDGVSLEIDTNDKKDDIIKNISDAIKEDSYDNTIDTQLDEYATTDDFGGYFFANRQDVCYFVDSVMSRIRKDNTEAGTRAGKIYAEIKQELSKILEVR